MDNLLWVGLGGFIGANARYLMTLWITGWMNDRFPNHAFFPIGTLTVNTLGSFGLAIFAVWIASRIGLPPQIKLIIGTGFFGAFTTFSTYANESIGLSQSHGWMPFVMNVLLNNGLCLVGVVLGVMVASRLFASGA